jgi:hypothetical protein
MQVGVKLSLNVFAWTLVLQIQLHNWLWHANKTSTGWQVIAGPIGLGFANRKRLLMIQATEAVQRKMQAARKGATRGFSNSDRR